MEVIRGTFHTAFPMGDPSRVGEARRHAALLAADCGLDETEAGRLAIVVTELGTNLVRHAQGGRLLLSARRAQQEVEVVAIDDGPGIRDVARSLGDGYSTSSTPGTGLGAVKRQSREFDIHSSAQGTVVVARVRPAPARAADDTGQVVLGAISLAAPGQVVCGDAWAFAVEGSRAAVMVADGLGHGPDAAEASGKATEVFAENPLMAPRNLLERVHVRLRSTRGAAVTLMQADIASGTIRTSGAGNVVGRVISGIGDRTLLTQHGTAGVTIRTPDEVTSDWPDHALLVVCSDGIETRWKADLLHPVLRHDPVIVAAVLMRHHFRGRDDATVAVLRRND
jgi:anti-sigma regulatory factor (Ser/Thr protein kinase)